MKFYEDTPRQRALTTTLSIVTALAVIVLAIVK